MRHTWWGMHREISVIFEEADKILDADGVRGIPGMSDFRESALADLLREFGFTIGDVVEMVGYSCVL